MRHSSVMVLLTIVCLGAPLFSAEANLIINGSFEEPPLAYGTWNIFQSIPGWSLTFGPGIEVQNHYAPPFEGDQFVELDSDSNSGISQIVATTPGQDYLLSFAYAPRGNVSAESNAMQVLFDGFLLDDIQASGIGIPADGGWTLHNYLVSATGMSSTLAFRAAGTSDGYGAHLDAVSFAPVPEPSTLLLLGSGLAGLAGIGWRQNRK